MEVKINREIRDYSEAVYFGLNLRQFVFSVLACGIAVGLYFLLKPFFGIETLSWVCIVGAAPFATLGFFKYHGMTAEKVLITYADEGITGTCVNKRDEFKRMMKDASNGKLDRIFVKSVSRFARNSLECLESIRTLNSFGVTVLFENDNIDTKTMNSELILYVKSAFAQSEALAGSKRVATAIRMKMENGEFITCNAPYGYKLDKECHLSVIPKEAEIIKRIYKLYLSGNGIGKIVAILNDERIPNTSGKWSVPGIRYILTNEKYIGDSLLQKTYTPQMLPLRNVPNKGELDRYYVANSHEGIISREDFELVQIRMKQVTSDRRAPQKHFFTGVIECAECGWSYKRKVQNDIVYWVCSQKTMAGHSCGGKNISEEDLKKAFVIMYNKFRRFEKEVLDKTLSQLLNLREKVSGQNNEISQTDAEIASLCNKNNTYTELHAKGIIDDVSYLERTSELKYKITELRAKRVKLLNADEDERLIEDLKVLKETLDEYPKVILRFDNSLFSAIVDKVVVGSEKTVMFQLKGGLHFDVKKAEVI